MATLVLTAKFNTCQSISCCNVLEPHQSAMLTSEVDFAVWVACIFATTTIWNGATIKGRPSSKEKTKLMIDNNPSQWRWGGKNLNITI